MLAWVREELVEARLLRTVYGVNHRTADELARLAYLTLLAIEILRHENSSVAEDYAKRSVWTGSFDKLNPSATDLYNLLVILANQDQYEELIHTNYDVSPALLETAAYLRRVWMGGRSQLQDRFVLINIGKMLDVDGADIQALRRINSFWEQASRNDKRWAINTLISSMRRLSPTVDIFPYIVDLV